MPDGRTVDAFTLSNSNGISLRVLTLGGIIQSLNVPDCQGRFDDVVLGYDSLDAYLRDSYFLGAIVGRFANRIARGCFALDGREYTLSRNDGRNHLHGGPSGFHRALWDANASSDDAASRLVLRYTSASGEEGYPGTLQVRVTYELTNVDELVVDFRAVTDAATPINLAQHSYFNLAGHGRGSILDHELTLRASQFLAVDSEMIPSGEIRSVTRTAFDFRSPMSIGGRIADDDEDLRLAGGYDHCFVLDERMKGRLAFAARLCDPSSGRLLEVSTTEPGIQVYSGNSLGERIDGKGDALYGRRSGIALETQHFPNSPNEPSFPSTILRPDVEFTSTTAFRISTQRTAT